MMNTDENKPVAKPAQRSRKTEPRSRKPAQPRSPKPEQLNAVKEQIDAIVASTDAPPIGTQDPNEQADAIVTSPDTAAVGAEDSKAQTGATIMSTDTSPAGAMVTPTNASPTGAAVPADAIPVSLQTIANAYGDYTRKSLDQTRYFFEKLTGVRSLDKAVEIQTEFAKQAYETFVAESQKIRELHSELAKQRLKRLERLVAKVTAR